MKLQPARRVFKHSDGSVTHGPWHARREDGRTLCHQKLSGAPSYKPVEVTSGSQPPAGGKLCTRCWDRATERPGRRGGAA